MFQIFPSTQTEQNLGHFTPDARLQGAPVSCKLAMLLRIYEIEYFRPAGSSFTKIIGGGAENGRQ